MRVPRLVSHVFDEESKSVTFGWVLGIVATLLYMMHMPGFDVNVWQTNVFVSAALVGGKMVKETILEGKNGKSSPGGPVAP